MTGLIGKKLGMTRIFNDADAVIPVTLIAVGGNRVAQVKTAEKDGYAALQLAFGEKKIKRLSKPARGHLAKCKAGSAALLREFRGAEVPEGKESGDEVEPGEVFADGQMVDITGTSKGKGFAGVIKRHHFSANRATHGNSRAHRKPGSTGQCQDPGRTFPGKKMPGQLGNKRCTTQNAQIVRIDAARKLLLIKGAVPGAPGSYVLVKPAVKKRAQG